MSNHKKEESEIKLDLGANEEEEEEESDEEEEDEEEEVVDEEDDEEEEDDMADDMADFDLEAMNNLNENRNIVVNPEAADINTHENEQVIKQKPVAGTGQKSNKYKLTLDKTKKANFQNTPKNQTQMNKLFSTEPTYTGARTEGGDNKSVFTKISEELFTKFINNKDTQNKKTSAYDYLINDLYLNRVCEKNDKDTHQKFVNFFNRNKEFRDKKGLRLQERVEKINQETNTVCTGIPNNKVFTKEELRSPDDFLNDQLKYYNTRDLNVNQQREDVLKTTNALLRQTPEISKKSQRLAKKKAPENKEVHDRLFSEKLNKQKTHLYTEKETKGKKNRRKEKIPNDVKKSKQEIEELVAKLTSDAKERKENKEKVKLEEVYQDLTTVSCKKVILEKFVNNYELILLNLFNQKDSVVINFESYCNMMLSLGFIRYDHHRDEEEVKNQDSEKEIKKREKEMKILKQSWRVLEGKQEDNKDSVDSNQLLVFCAALLGLYKGEDMHHSNLQTENVNTNMNTQMNIESTVNNTQDVKFSSNNSPVNEKVKARSKSNKKKNSKIPNRFSTPSQHHKYATLSTPVNKNKTASGTTFNKTHVSGKAVDQSNVNIIKVVLPELDLNKYYYLKPTVKQIKMLFRYFYDNRVNILIEQKKLAFEAKKDFENKDLVFRQTVRPSEKLEQSAENFRRRVFSVYIIYNF